MRISASAFRAEVEEALSTGVQWSEETHGHHIKQDLECHRCGAGFGSAFAKLKKHLAVCTARCPRAI